MKHVKETTTSSTLREVKNNISDQNEKKDVCFECLSIARKIGLDQHTL